MNRVTGWIFVAGLLAGLTTFGQEEITSPIPESTAATNSTEVLWAGMHEAGMIDDEQYQYVLENGCLPGGTTLTNSPVPDDSLVNDVDLRIIGPDATVYYPFVLDPNDPGATATTDDNFRDNVEQVVVTNTIAGFYTVVIDHKDTLVNGGQDLSMLLSASTIPFATPDPTLSLSVSTNGLPLLEWEAEPGALQAVMSSDNLANPLHWATNSIYSIIRVTNEWVDPADFSYPARFYKIQEIE